MQAYLGPPSAQARYEILRSGVLELARAGLIGGECHAGCACVRSAGSHAAAPERVHANSLLRRRNIRRRCFARNLHTDVASPQQLMPYKALELLPAASRSAQQQPSIAGGGSSIAAATAAANGGSEEAAEVCSLALWQVVAACDGFSGRSLRKLPFLAHATAESLPVPCGCIAFLAAMQAAAEREKAERSELSGLA
jgi:hypothetical protein